ncbi:hypothetical protein [Roseateles sp.]|uniref:hypothetical protein n=1 Tax=Roseateles sp. TaxID=1971397 RepID=UPI0031D6D2FD
MGINYYALGKTTWQAIKLEDYQGVRGARLEGLDQIGEVCLHTDETYERVCEALFGEYRMVYWPRQLLELFMRRFAEENPDGVEYWASDSISVYDEPKEGSFGWINGNHGQSIEYMYFRDMWEIADRYVPELRNAENMKKIFGEAYGPYMRELRTHVAANANGLEKKHRSSLLDRLKLTLGIDRKTRE